MLFDRRLVGILVPRFGHEGHRDSGMRDREILPVGAHRLPELIGLLQEVEDSIALVGGRAVLGGLFGVEILDARCHQHGLGELVSFDALVLHDLRV